MRKCAPETTDAGESTARSTPLIALTCRILHEPDLVADPRGFFVVFEFDGKLKLLLQLLERPQGTLTFDFTAPA